MNLYIDIETIGTSDPKVIEEITEGITPPKTMSKADTIAKWNAEERPALVNEAIAKTAFDGAYGHVICVGYAIDNDGKVGAFFGGTDEKQLLRNFFGITKPLDLETVHVIGHNVSWDIRFMWQRAVVMGIERPRWLNAAVKSKPWDANDTMTLWNPDRDKKIKLAKLCEALGVPTPKVDMDGSKVWDAYREGRLQDIATYCMGDVTAMRECYKRMY